ncbi:MAG TPA: Wzy polymerase domain-containing protein [Acidovorax sp.]|nr:Wzy polymerase domain-containing protein [Acidovorax sp.]
MKPDFAHHNTSLWAGLLTLGLAAGWLLPNHYAPWLAFHANAWVACALLLIALRGLYLTKGPVGLTPGGLALVLVAAIPWIQHWTGLLPLRSDAALISLCLAGAAFAYIVAQHWSKASPLRPAAYVLTAMAIAAVISTALATYQWLGLANDLGLMDIWVLPFSEGTRPYANMGQPNQLASLLLCGLLGIAWHRHTGALGKPLGLALAAWIVWGIALTESRTALLTLVAGMVFLTVRAPAFLKTNEVRAGQAIFSFYLLCLFGKARFAQILGLDMPLSVLERSAGELRTSLWKMAVDASLQSPWVGNGWGKSTIGYFNVFEKYREKFGNTYFEHSHNLFLDLVLWVGWPLAIVISLLAVFWLYRAIRCINKPQKLFVFAAMAVLLIHSMLEFPLHYGYFLWPFCILAGSLAVDFEKGMTGRFALPRSVAFGIFSGLILLETIVVIDYLKIEEAFTELRFQIARIGTGHDETLPKTFFLTDWPDVIALTRKTPSTGMKEDEIKHWQALMIYNTSPLAIRKVIGAYKLNGNEMEAKAWALRTCWLLSDKACAGLYDEWQVGSSVKPAGN